MKKRILTIVGALALMSSVSFGQLIDETNVTITMDLQPILQLNLQGPDQIDFTFDQISEYYSGITKYAATVLKVSSSVSFDLWATGLSTQANFIWDQVVPYSTGGGTVATIPLSALEIRQFPPNPSVAAAALCPLALVGDEDYSPAFAPYSLITNDFAAGAAVNNLYTTANATPYTAPTTTGVVLTGEKYIAGASGFTAGCSQTAGSYLTVPGPPTPANAGYYFVLDYRILPGLPVRFPAGDAAGLAPPAGDGIAAATQTGAAGSNFDASGAAGALNGSSTAFVAPGVYTMYIKYVMVQDQ
ncbi:MAG: hypothetical protein JKX73_03810 [Flavobacteriales bacterium]|nr:hypothetical protein [Flavobacteriales bacterium]